MKNKTKTYCAISGANGFIASHLIKRLKELEIEVIPLPRQLLYEPYTGLQTFLTEHNPDYIYHLASYGNLYSQQEEDKIVMANYFATWNLLQASKYINYKAFIHFATSKHSQDSNTFYGATKKGAQALCFAHAKQYDKPIVSIEPFTVIGITEPKEHLIPTIIQSCLIGDEMPFVSDPSHDYIGVTDFINALQLIVDNIRITKGNSYEIGTGKTYTNGDILNMVEQLTNKHANIRKIKLMREYDSQDWRADIKPIAALGWAQEQHVQGVIKEMIEYEKERTKNT